MRFWDSSAVLPLCLEDPDSERLQHLAREDPLMVAWWGTVVECASAVARLRRDGVFDVSQERAVETLLQEVSAAWIEVQPSDDVRRWGIRLMRRHPLRAADALQLAAAQLWANGRPEGNAFVCLDHRLRDAARREGFSVIPQFDDEVGI